MVMVMMILVMNDTQLINLMQAGEKRCNSKITYPAVLDMQPYCTREVLLTGFASAHFALSAAILHDGNGVGGHYTCFTKAAPGKFLYRDDAKPVQLIGEATALSFTQRVAALFYDIMLPGYVWSCCLCAA